MSVQLPALCLDIPIDHRLGPLLGTGLTRTSTSVVEFDNHAQEIENYGHYLQKYRKDITNDEVNFARWLAKPETKGGVVIVLERPAQYQQYFSDHHQTVKNCNTLDGVDQVCRTVTGYGLEHISCFDAFPFHKLPVRKSLYDYQRH
jgi:hypothetical protein